MNSSTIQYNVDLHAIHTFGFHVKSHAYVQITTEADLISIAQHPLFASLPHLVLGGGSNIVFTEDYPGLILHMCNKGITLMHEDNAYFYVKVAAGERWHDFVMWSIAHSMGGLENLALIPGTVGAAPIQNIGAYGAEVKDTLQQLSYVDMTTGQSKQLTKKECHFAYRDSIFKHALKDNAVVTDVTFALPKQWQPNVHYGDVQKTLGDLPLTPENIANAVIAIRRHKLPDPAVIGNAGSFFKNPIVTRDVFLKIHQQYPNLVHYEQSNGDVKLAAGWLIDQCGWKGKRVGNVGVYDKQALILVNYGDATGKEIADLARHIQSDVAERFGVTLLPEPVFVGK